MDRTSKKILKVSTIFPFTFFPCELEIDLTKVNIVDRTFFYSEVINTILIKNLEEITVETSLFFATLKIFTKGFHDEPIAVKYLKKEDAIEARKIIQELIAVDKAGVELSQFNPHEIKGRIEELGSTTVLV